jgi:hypothetical protein
MPIWLNSYCKCLYYGLKTAEKCQKRLHRILRSLVQNNGHFKAYNLGLIRYNLAGASPPMMSPSSISYAELSLISLVVIRLKKAVISYWMYVDST